MGLFGPFTYKTKRKVKYFLHVKDIGKVKLYYFSKDPIGSLSGIPKGYEASENEKTGMPFLRKIKKETKEKSQQPA